jgi:hypothetical protein
MRTYNGNNHNTLKINQEYTKYLKKKPTISENYNDSN